MMRARIAFADRFAPLIRILLQDLPVNPGLQGLLQEGGVGRLTLYADAMIGREVARGRMRPIRRRRSCASSPRW